jgi:hypothetical protein
VSQQSDWAELRSVSGSLLISAFRWSGQWDEYGVNDKGIPFGARQELSDALESIIAFVTIPNTPRRLPREVVEAIANESGYGIGGLVDLVRRYRASKRGG